MILITDIKGNLMHRMEGKCEAPEMLARLRQGLNDDLNLKALQQKYQDGERDIRFLEYFLETLHIAGLREQKAEIPTERSAFACLQAGTDAPEDGRANGIRSADS